MLYSKCGMPIVFVIARDRTLRAAVRAELLEMGIQGVGIEEADDAGRAIAGGQMPSVVVLEASESLACNPAIQELVRRVPTVLVASRTETFPLPPVAALLYRPVRVGDIVARVRELAQRSHAV